MEAKNRTEGDEFKRRLRDEWSLMWRERFDDKIKAEGIAVKDYPLLFMDRGVVIFASKDAKTPVFRDLADHWASQGKFYSPHPSEGGWGKFINNRLKPRRVASDFIGQSSKDGNARLQQKKGGRGWLHK